jgi:hypothetical protein
MQQRSGSSISLVTIGDARRPLQAMDFVNLQLPFKLKRVSSVLSFHVSCILVLVVGYLLCQSLSKTQNLFVHVLCAFYVTLTL